MKWFQGLLHGCCLQSLSAKDTAPLPEDHEHLESAREALQDMEPPAYSEQGQPRGRKPGAKSKSKAKKPKETKAKTGKTKATKTRRTKGAKKTKTGKRARATEGEEEENHTDDEHVNPDASHVCGAGDEDHHDDKAAEETPAEETPADDATAPTAGSVPNPSKRPRRSRNAAPKPKETFDVPNDLVPAPEGVPTNLIYSKAYAREKERGGEVADWQRAGRKATWLLREYKSVSPSLSGPAEYKPKGKRSKASKNAAAEKGNMEKGVVAENGETETGEVVAS